MLFKEKIEILCFVNKTTFGTVAKELGIARSSLSKWETSDPKEETKLSLAHYFKVSPEWLINDTEIVDLEKETEVRDIIDLLHILNFSKKGYAMAKDMLISIRRNIDNSCGENVL